MTKVLKRVFQLTILEDGSFEVITEDKQIKGQFTTMHALMAAMTVLMAGASLQQLGRRMLKTETSKGFKIIEEK